MGNRFTLLVKIIQTRLNQTIYTIRLKLYKHFAYENHKFRNFLSLVYELSDLIIVMRCELVE